MCACGADCRVRSGHRADELAEGAEPVAEYKRVRHLVRHGVLYRPAGPNGEGPTVVQYAAGDGAGTLVLAWRRGPGERGLPDAPVRLRGLTPGARSRDRRTGAVHHAAVLDAYGLRLELPGRGWSSTAVHLARVADADGADRPVRAGSGRWAPATRGLRKSRASWLAEPAS
ncbi:GH36 C-terminal domain-containing protein [Streptomyces sp. NPDC056930]|uniref:GH36 C-terminal domain-containing protein n=1 Tax=Streptomyces sp. NPDC056930 TaxID=3345967 RepID=UPI00363FDAA6